VLCDGLEGGEQTIQCPGANIVRNVEVQVELRLLDWPTSSSLVLPGPTPTSINSVASSIAAGVRPRPPRSFRDRASRRTSVCVSLAMRASAASGISPARCLPSPSVKTSRARRGSC